MYKSIGAVKRFITFCDQNVLNCVLKNTPKLKIIFTHECLHLEFRSTVRGMSSITWLLNYGSFVQKKR